MSLNFNIIKLDEQAEKLIKLNFRMANLNANMVTVNKKTDRTSASLPKFTNMAHSAWTEAFRGDERTLLLKFGCGSPRTFQ